MGLCFQPALGGSLTNFANQYLTAEFTGQRRTYSATFSTFPGAGNWRVGMCVRNRGLNPISNNHLVNGWVMVT